MTRTEICTVSFEMQTVRSILRQVPDPRGKKGRQHPLEALLGLMLLSVLCGRKGMMAAFRLGRSLSSKQLQRLGFRRGRPAPCHATLTELLRILDANAMARVFSQFIAASDEGASDEEARRHISIDGKTLRAHCAEFGLVTTPGVRNIVKLAHSIFNENDEKHVLPAIAQVALATLARRLLELEEELQALEKVLRDWHRQNEASRRLAAIPGIGVITATALMATVSDPGQFKSGRQFAAWLGLVPKQHSSGDKVRLAGISKQGDRYIRRLLVIGATAVIRHNRNKKSPTAVWINGLLEKKPVRLVSVALANKTARIAWVLMTRGQRYNPLRISAA